MFKKDDIVFVEDQGSTKGSVQRFARPAIIIQNNTGNHFSPTTIVAYITGKEKRKDLPVHVTLKGYNLSKTSTILLEQLTTVSKSDIVSKIDHLRDEDKVKVDAALRVSLGLAN